MIKTMLATAIITSVFTGCVGTVIANNDVKRSPSTAVQNAKSTAQQAKNVTSENNSSVSKKETIIKKKVP
jgi:hypothetical protein